jgi:hypothetical protein
MLKQLTMTAGALLVLSACTDTVTAPVVPDGDLLRLSRQATVEVCHVDGEGRIRVISVAAPAVAAHQAHGDALPGPLSTAGATFTASSAWLGNTADMAFDGDVATGWNAGAYPVQWIEVDFGSPQAFSGITALVNQLPRTAVTNHEVTLDGVPAFSWNGETNHLDLLSYAFGTMQTAQTVRITTTASPSWVAWFEIQILGC